MQYYPYLDIVFGESCKKNGNSRAIILEDGKVEYTYGELNIMASNLENTLRQILYADEKIVSFDDCINRTVSLMTERNVAMIVAILAILKAGASYVPVDPSFPPDRQAHIFSHSKSKLLLVDTESYEKAIALGVSLPPVVVIHPSTGEILKKPEIKANVTESPQFVVKRSPRDMAYVLYTSGSTGKPKGVMVTHEGVVNIVNWFADELRVDSKSVVLGLTTFCFDISVLEMFMPLFRGGTLVIASSATQKDPFHLLDVIHDRRVTVMQATPTTYEMMLATGWLGDPSIDLLVGGGSVPALRVHEPT